LLNKELRLAVSPLSWVFLAGALMTLLPGYPILMGSFFVCLGIFYSFQNAREANDVLFTLLLPVRKRAVAAAKYAVTCLFQLLAFLLMAALTALRMTALADAAVYRANVMMNATPLYLAFALLVFAAFNLLFLGGFFRTAYQIGGPFLAFSAGALLVIFAGEALHHLPGLGFLNAPAGERLGLQLLLLVAGAAVYALVTLLSYRAAARRFEKLDF